MAQSLFHMAQERGSIVDAIRENSGRHAVAYGNFLTTGTGEIANPDPLMFNTAYVDMPAASYSYFVDTEDLIDSRWPRCWGGVLGWVTSNQDDYELYTGANVFVVVETESLQLPPDISDPDAVDDPWYTIRHFFTFNGVGLKFVPTDFAAAQIREGG